MVNLENIFIVKTKHSKWPICGAKKLNFFHSLFFYLIVYLNLSLFGAF